MFLPQTMQRAATVVLLPADKIDPSLHQPRRQFDEAALSALAASIKENGLLQPVTVRRAQDGRYTLIAGERRLRACKLCGMEKVPAIIMDKSHQQAAVLTLEENLQRADLSPFEEAEALRSLQELWQTTQADTAARLGISQPSLANKLRLLQLSPAVRADCEEARLTGRHIRTVLRLEEEKDQLRAVAAIKDRQLTVAAAERMVDAMLRAKAPRPCRRLVVKDVRIFTNTVERAVKVLKSAGIPASCERIEKTDCIEYLVRIPNGSA